ncbi:chaperone NapD [uncultured Lutibacter sp.]|uniref:chaperone NapD n=1 Tax=uncultured Lutibacter sp. TaxID=437739 RepID=UPI002625B931|nr:chaperone NapD [uncultured Lutibacter sp.]
MPIKSYILHCEDQKKEILLKELQKLPNCEVIPAQNHEVIVIVTDTDSEETDTELYNKLLEIKGLKHLSLVSGFDAKQ